MDHHHHHPLGQSEGVGGSGIGDPFDDLHLEEVITCPQGSELIATTVYGVFADLARVGPGRRAPFFAAIQVTGPPVAGVQGRGRPPRQHLVDQMAGSDGSLPDPAGDAAVEVGHDRVPVAVEVWFGQVGGDQAHPATDVEADPTRRDHAATFDGGGRHPADREPIAPVDVGHGEGGLDDARQVGDVRHLGRRLVLADHLHQGIGGEDDPGYVHSSRGRDLPAEVRDSRQVHGYNPGLSGRLAPGAKVRHRSTPGRTSPRRVAPPPGRGR